MITNEEILLSPKDVRRIAATVPDCTEIQQKDTSNILSFIVIDSKNEPIRLQIYCNTATASTCRILNGEVREIFQRKCTLRQVHQIFNQPLTLPTADPRMFDSAEENEEREPSDSYNEGSDETMMHSINKVDKKTLRRDEDLVDIGISILAGEFDSLMSHFKSLIRDRKRFDQRIEQQRLQNIMMQHQQQQQQLHSQQQQQHEHKRLYNQQPQPQQQQQRNKPGRKPQIKLTNNVNQQGAQQQMQRKQMREQLHQIHKQQQRQKAKQST
mmetsp:Transcript_6368/g.8069  ORF Transcript_6368/g.8069 Transcript_6368/m.8069 type:complete len:269 (-) Transcript_6368:4145-4951(-)